MLSSSPRVHKEEARVVSMVPRPALVMASLCLVHPAAHRAVALYDPPPPNTRAPPPLRRVLCPHCTSAAPDRRDAAAGRAYAMRRQMAASSEYIGRRQSRIVSIYPGGGEAAVSET